MRWIRRLLLLVGGVVLASVLAWQLYRATAVERVRLRIIEELSVALDLPVAIGSFEVDMLALHVVASDLTMGEAVRIGHVEMFGRLGESWSKGHPVFSARVSDVWIAPDRVPDSKDSV